MAGINAPGQVRITADGEQPLRVGHVQASLTDPATTRTVMFTDTIAPAR